MTILAAAPALTVHRSRKLIPEFNLHRPRTTAEAVAIKSACGRGGVFMAGGIDVVNRMKFGVPVSDLIHLGGVAGLDEIVEEDGKLRLGSLVTHHQMATSPLVARHLPALAETWRDVANIRIRCKGTLGGNIMAGDPNYDFALAVMAADARLEFLEPGGKSRTVAAIEPDALATEGLLLAIIVPSVSTLRLWFDRSLRPTVTMAFGLNVTGQPMAEMLVAIGCACTTPSATRLVAHWPISAESVAGLTQSIAATLPEPIGDHNAGAVYRRRMIEVLLRRNLSVVA
jgi:aerobic carbon-monoxide dehydrogenase medium subunit